ncbi:MAG: DUF1638 domain-containing protein [Armatimonadetes bacterium]|nr:DUF1638 domain-containing protein [Armatimonadota bacterium]MDE2206588.1 DUF1638 domain-containing protein [Armatimonadota bacterium]
MRGTLASSRDLHPARHGAMNLKLISCEVFCREAEHVITQSPHHIEVTFLPMGLHDIGARGMRPKIQAAVDAVDDRQFDAILLGFGLCSNGLAGIVANGIPLVLPRAHDCITLFLGSSRRYLDYFHAHPGVYFKTTGWIEHSSDLDSTAQLSLQRSQARGAALADLIARYGEDNGRYLHQTLSAGSEQYGQITFIEMGVEPNAACEQHSRDEARARGWQFEKVRGDIGMIQRLVSGDWRPEEFLVVQPGSTIAARYDESIVAAEPAPESRHTDGGGPPEPSASGAPKG